VGKVHPGGNPISHSTNLGFSSGPEPPGNAAPVVVGPGGPVAAHIFAACVRGTPARVASVDFVAWLVLRAWNVSGLSPSLCSAALGVGHWRTASVSVVPAWLVLPGL
jgi:hypothetical protein